MYGDHLWEARSALILKVLVTTQGLPIFILCKDEGLYKCELLGVMPVCMQMTEEDVKHPAPLFHCYSLETGSLAQPGACLVASKPQ